jgi:hypothetical protein
VGAGGGGCGPHRCRDRPGPRDAGDYGVIHDVEGLRRFGRLHAVLGAHTDRQDQREQAGASLVLPGGGGPGAAAVQPDRCRRCDVRRRREGRRRRARCGDREADLDVNRAGSRTRSHLLGERRSIRSAAAAQHRRRPPRDRRCQRRAHQVVRKERLRRHAYGRAAPAGGTQQDTRPDLRKPDRGRIQHRRRVRIATRRPACLRRGHGPASLDLPHDSTPRRVRLRHVAARRMEVRRRRQHVG